ncbi:MAG TPA: hypothetical protein VF857_07865, partial [Spirochaetota bacterium]
MKIIGITFWLSVFIFLGVSPQAHGTPDIDNNNPTQMEMGLSLSAPPEISGVSNDPVLIRYKFEKGKTTDIEYSINLMVKMTVNNQSVDIPLRMMLSGNYSVDSVDEMGDASITLVLTRLKIESTGRHGIFFDSAQDPSSDTRRLTSIREILNLGIPVRVSSIGDIPNIEINAVGASLEAEEAARQINIEKLMNDMMKSSFVLLPVNPVKKGESYDAGVIIQPMGDIAVFFAKIRYQVRSVSADGKKIILVPIGVFELKGRDDSATKCVLNNGWLDGWLLFNI